MRIICAILSILGLGWAWTALGIYFLLAVILFDSPKSADFASVVYVSLGCILATIGYWIWTGWILRSLKDRCHWATPRTFWMISILQHAGWFLFLSMFEVVNHDSWMDQDFGPLFLWWNVALMIISALGLFMEWNHPKPKRKRENKTVEATPLRPLPHPRR